MTIVNRMVDERPCNVFVVLRRVGNCRSIIIIITTRSDFLTQNVFFKSVWRPGPQGKLTALEPPE